MRNDIARAGSYSIRYKTFICEHDYTTHDIEIVKWDGSCCYTIMSANNGSMEYEDTFLDALVTYEDLINVKLLCNICNNILKTEETPITL